MAEKEMDKKEYTFPDGEGNNAGNEFSTKSNLDNLGEEFTTEIGGDDSPTSKSKLLTALLRKTRTAVRQNRPKKLPKKNLRTIRKRFVSAFSTSARDITTNAVQKKRPYVNGKNSNGLPAIFLKRTRS